MMRRALLVQAALWVAIALPACSPTAQPELPGANGPAVTRDAQPHNRYVQVENTTAGRVTGSIKYASLCRSDKYEIAPGPGTWSKSIARGLCLIGEVTADVTFQIDQKDYTYAAKPFVSKGTLVELFAVRKYGDPHLYEVVVK